MTLTVTDPVLIQSMTTTNESITLETPDGVYLGRIMAPMGKPPPGYKIPFTEEEIAEFRKQKTGRPLKEILRDLEALG